LLLNIQTIQISAQKRLIINILYSKKKNKVKHDIVTYTTTFCNSYAIHT